VTRGLEQLEPLIGEWTSSSETYPDGRGRMTVALVDDGKFLRIHAQVEDERFPVSTQVVGADDSDEECSALYFDSRGVHRVYRMVVTGNEWRVWRDAPKFNQRYTGKIGGDGRSITGQWEFSEDGKSWKVDFDLNYQKVD